MAEEKNDITALMNPYETWVRSHGVPVHAGYYVETTHAARALA